MPHRNWNSWFFAALPACLGIFGIILALLPYEYLKAFTGSLMPDGNFNSLKPWNADELKLLFGLGGIGFLFLAGLTGLRRWKIFRPLSKQVWADAGDLFSSLRPHKDELGFLIALVVIMVLGVVYRLEYIYSSLHHDEAYTYIAFAHSLFAAMTDYHLPNNHIFHSILVHISTRIFGIQPWAVRLPAFLAGVLLVPATYWLAKRLYDRWTALAAALLVTWFPILINYSTNARGYTLLALFTLLTLTFGSIVRIQKNRFVWILISLFSALGLYTIPVMLFPFGILFVWLLLDNQLEPSGAYKSKKDFLFHWIAAGFGTAILTSLFYLPVLIFTGLEKVISNAFVSPLPWGDLLETLSHRLTETWLEWTSGVPLFLVVILMAGWILSLIFHRRISTIRVPIQLSAVLWIFALIILQRPNAWAKVWLFLLPLMLMWAAAGSVGLLRKIRITIFHFPVSTKFEPDQTRAIGNCPPLTLILIGIVLGVGIQQAVWLGRQLPEIWASQGSEEKAVLFVQNQLQNTDLIIVAPPDDASVWYYSELHGILKSHFDSGMTFDRALVLVNPVEGQTIASVIAERGPDPNQLDLGSCQPLGTFDKIQVFECTRQ
jgi:hypothetical protein